MHLIILITVIVVTVKLLKLCCNLVSKHSTGEVGFFGGVMLLIFVGLFGTWGSIAELCQTTDVTVNSVKAVVAPRVVIVDELSNKLKK